MRKRLAISLVAALPIALLAAGTAGASQHIGQHHGRHHPGVNHPVPAYSVSTVLSGASLSHAVGVTSQPLSQPDDLANLGDELFVAFQNGVGPSGLVSSTGNSDSTIVEFTPKGTVLKQWDIPGHVDGLTGTSTRSNGWGARVRLHDRRARGEMLATANEDGNSSLFTIDPGAPASSAVTQYLYNQSPLPHGGGTDAISIYHDRILISASAPSPSPANVPAVYSVVLQPPSGGATTGTAVVTSLFSDEATATSANTGASVTLALTDPDSNVVVPESAPRFGGDFMLDSQGDMEQIYVHDAGGSHQSLSVLRLTQSVDDTQWATERHGVLYASDATNDVVDAVTGPFQEGSAFSAVTACDSNSAPAVCPALPLYPANYLASLDMSNGTLTPVTTTGVALVPKGLLFVQGGERERGFSDRGHSSDHDGSH